MGAALRVPPFPSVHGLDVLGVEEKQQRQGPGELLPDDGAKLLVLLVAAVVEALEGVLANDREVVVQPPHHRQRGRSWDFLEGAGGLVQFLLRGFCSISLDCKGTGCCHLLCGGVCLPARPLGQAATLP